MEDYSPLISAISSLLTVTTAPYEGVQQQLQTAIDTLIIYVNNVLSNMNEPKFRKVKKTLPAFERRIGALPRAKAAFHLLGWADGTGEDREFYVLEISPATVEMVEKRLRFARGELERVKQELLEHGPKFVDPAVGAGVASSAAQGRAASIHELNEIFPQIEGVRFRVPPDWTLFKVEPTRGLAVFKSASGAVVVLNYLPQPLQRVWLDDAFLCFYRHNLRLHAAHNKGGLVECDIYPEGFVAGITKRPQPEEYAGGRGITYHLHLLVPAKQGVISAVILADEGRQTGLREALMMAVGNERQDPETSGGEWFADPYGYPIPIKTPVMRTVNLDSPFTAVEAQEMNPPSGAAEATLQGVADDDDDGWFDPWRGMIYPRSRADDSQHDQAFAFHPLSKVRAILGQLVRLIEVSDEVKAACKPAEPTRPQPVHIIDDVHCLIPAGFAYMPAPNMTHGKVFIRSGFESTLEVCNLTLQPMFPDCGRTLEAAQAIARQHAEWGHLKLLHGPIIKAGTIAGKQGMINESESILNGQPVYTIAFYLPWGDGASLEVSAVTQRGNHEEARQRLTAIVESLQSRQ